MGDFRLSLGGIANRLLGQLESVFGHNPETDDLATQINDLKSSAYADNQLSDKELSAIHDKMAAVEARYAKYAASRGFPIGNNKPASPESFKVYQQQQQIQFEWFAGKDLRSGAVGDLAKAVKAGDSGKVDSLTSKVAFDLVTSDNT